MSLAPTKRAPHSFLARPSRWARGGTALRRLIPHGASEKGVTRRQHPFVKRLALSGSVWFDWGLISQAPQSRGSKVLTTPGAPNSKPNPSRRLSRRLILRSYDGDHSLLPGIAPLIDLLPGGEEIFLNVRGKAVLLLIEISPGTPGEAAVRGFLRTMRFPA